MNLLFRRLAERSRLGMSDYSNEYLASIKQVFELSTKSNTLKSQIQSKDFKSIETLLNCSLVFNDLTLITLPKEKELALTCLSPNWFEQHFGVRSCSVTLSENKSKELGLGPQSNIHPSFVFSKGKDTDEFLSKLEVLLESERLLIQPDRVLLVESPEATQDGRRHWNTLNVSGHSPLDNWQILEEQNERPIDIEYQSSDNIDHRTVFDLTLPYLEGVDYSDLVKILNDESDLISSLRKSIKDTVKESNDNDDAITIARDCIDPKIDLINRKFKSLVNTHSFRVAGAGIGTVVLAYTAVATSGLSAAFATIGGSGGLGLLGKEYGNFKEKYDSIKNDPYYFLWKCRKKKK